MSDSAVFITNEQKLNLKAGDMFDKIINLKINCMNKDGQEESFVIRSDYELIYPDSSLNIDGDMIPYLRNSCIIRRCSIKPSIKVQCKMVSSNTGINAEVYVTNFFMLTHNGKHLRSFNSSQYKIKSVEIAMGYWGQFRIGEESESLAPSFEDYFNIDAKNGADKITLTGTIVVTTDKLPPDSVLHIKGYVADVYSSPVAVSKITDAEKALSNPVASSGKGFEEVCYSLITRRYLNKHYFTDGAGSKIKTGKRNVAVSDIEDYDVPVNFDPDTGLLSTTDADKYGVKVYLSNEAKKIAIPKARDEQDNEVEKVLYFEAGWTIGQTIARIITFMEAELDYTFTKKGDVLIYSTSEVTDPKKLNDAFETEGLYEDTVLANKKFYNNRLPAVYNINIDAVATITCPFFTFFEPFQYIEFASRYALTSVVSYFASYSPTIYRFLIINASISFATVDEVNEVQITAVSARDATLN